MYQILFLSTSDYIISSVRTPGKGKEITLLYAPTHSLSLLCSLCTKLYIHTNSSNKGLPVLFEPDSTVECVDIEIVDDNNVEDEEKFKITLVTKQLVKVAREADMAVVTIVNDDERKSVSLSHSHSLLSVSVSLCDDV